MLPIPEFIIAICSMLPNWSPKNTCQGYVLSCTYNGLPSKDKAYECLNMWVTNNKAHKPYNALIECYEKKDKERVWVVCNK